MSMNSVNLNSMSLAEKIKLMQQQKGVGKTTTVQTAKTNSMNTSIFNNPQVRSMNSAQTTQGTQGTQGTQTTQGAQTSGKVAAEINVNNNDNIFSKLNMVSTSQTGAAGETSGEKLYENPDKLETKQDITKAQTQLQIQMAKTGTNFKLESIAMKLDERLDAIEGGQNKNFASGVSTTSSSQAAPTSENVSESDGNSSTQEAESEQATANKKAKESESDQKEAKAMSKDAKADDKALQKDAKALTKQMKSAQTTMQKSQEEMTQLQTQMDQNQLEIDDAVNQITSLQSSQSTADSTGAGENSAFSLKLAGEEDPKTRSMNSTASTGSTGSTSGSTGAGQDNSAQIDSLMAKIDEKNASNTEIGVRMNTIQTKQNKAVVTMQHTVEMRNKYYTKMQKANQKQEKLTDKMLKVEQKINDIAVTVEKVGDITEKTGKAMEYAGNAMSAYPPTAAAGRALASAGGVVQKVGVVTQTVGQYGQTAAQAAMTLTYAAQGDIAGALQSAGSAIKTGASAVNNTKTMKSQMAAIDESVQQGQEKAAVALASKQAANEAKEAGTLGDMSKKEYAAGVKDQLNNKIKDGSLKQEDLMATVKDKDAGTKINGMVDKNKLTADVAAKKTGNVAGKAASKGGSSVFQKAGDWLADNGEKVGEQLSSLGQKYSAKKGTPQASAMVASGRTGSTARPDFSSGRSQLAQRRAKMGLG